MTDNLEQQQTIEQDTTASTVLSTVNDSSIETAISKNIEDWEKEIWEVTKVKAFMKRQSL